MIQQIYTTIALKHGVTVEQVQSDMQALIDATYKKPNKYAQRINYKGNKPELDEFIAHVVHRLQNEK